jgi:inner membrane protein
MDSLTQLALGASVAVAVMGRRTAVWKAATWGALAGTLPDLDALIDHGDAVLNMVLHRAETHALLYTLLFGLPLGALAAWWHGRHAPRERHTARWCTALALALVTHPMLDWFTVYGTQVLIPFTHQAYGLGSIFIIDPLYTLPLLAGVGWALRGPDHQGLKANLVALALSTAYLGWSACAQYVVVQQARQALTGQGLPDTSLLVTPTPFNTVLWRIVSVGPTHYHEGFYSLLDGPAPLQFTTQPLGADLLAQHGHHPHIQRVARFTDGFFKLGQHPNGDLWLTDLRMGQEPSYVFNFNIGPPLPSLEAPYPPAQGRSDRGDVPAALRWLTTRIGNPQVPPLSTNTPP